MTVVTFYRHYLIRLNVSSEKTDFYFNGFKKLTFQKIHLNALGSKLGLDVKNGKVNIGSSFQQTWQALDL